MNHNLEARISPALSNSAGTGRSPNLLVSATYLQGLFNLEHKFREPKGFSKSTVSENVNNGFITYVANRTSSGTINASSARTSVTGTLSSTQLQYNLSSATSVQTYINNTTIYYAYDSKHNNTTEQSLQLFLSLKKSCNTNLNFSVNDRINSFASLNNVK